MFKVLVVAHPDDEVIFFNPNDYDKIIIVFGDFGDQRGSAYGDKRRAALKELPYADKIEHLNFPESHHTWDRDNPDRKQLYDQNYRELCEYLRTLKADEVTTHGSWGEYNNLDHVLVHHACLGTLNCPVNGMNPELYRRAKNVYKKHGVWTWYF